MAVFKWVGGSVFLDQGRYAVASDWTDLTTGTSGVSAPQPGDIADVTGVVNAGISKAGALYVFPTAGGYPLIWFFAPQPPLTALQNPNALVGYTVQGQTLNIDGTLGAVGLWLQNSQLLNETINVTGTAVLSSYLDNTITGSITVGTAATPGFLQASLIPYDTALVGPTDHHPITTFNDTVTVNQGSTFDVEAAAVDSATGVINNGAINVNPGGTLIFDDTDNPQAATDNYGVTTTSHNLLLGNGGVINVTGSAGQTTKAALLLDVSGPGAITVNGNGAARAATAVTINGYMTGQAVTLTDGTFTVNDATTAVGDATEPGYDVTGGSFTFGDANGTLVLHQAALTTLQFNAGATGQVQTPDGRHPFTTPISGFGAGDVIALPGKDLSGFGFSTYVTSYNAATGVLQVQSPAGIAGNPPDVLAALTLVGQYDPALFQLTGNNTTQELDLTYGGKPVTDPLFDVGYYLAHNPDVAAAGVDPYQHYLTYGWIEGRNPDAFFDTKYYLQQNPDVRAAGVDPLLHFETYGWKEGRDPSLLFSDSKYLAANPDVAAAGMDPLQHALVYGIAEGRMTFLSGPSQPADPLVQAAYYDPQLGATLTPTGTAAAQQAAASYQASGWQQGQNPDPFFNTAYYLSHNLDVAAAHIDPLLHYETYGWREGRDPSAAFSTNQYLAAYADVKAAGVDPLLHFIQNGQAEGRHAFPS